MDKQTLLNLPEFKHATEKTLDNGDTVMVRNAPKFVTYDPSPDDTVLFRDDDGQLWCVEYGLEGGPYKKRMVG